MRSHAAESSLENATLASSLGDKEKKETENSVLGDRYQKTHQDFLQLKQKHTKLRTECDLMAANMKFLERRDAKGETGFAFRYLHLKFQPGSGALQP